VNEVAATQWPPYRHAYAELHSGGEVDYGLLIQWDRLLKLFNLPGGTRDSWKFRGQWFKLKDALEQDGYMLTEAGTSGRGIRILTREEMAPIIKARESRKAGDSLRKAEILGKVPRAGLDPETASNLDHWQLKTALLGATARTLMRRRVLPSPETFTPSLRQIHGGKPDEDEPNDHHP
jgi:hypothetical protein